jgi:hypothetical protein
MSTNSVTTREVVSTNSVTTREVVSTNSPMKLV